MSQVENFTAQAIMPEFLDIAGARTAYRRKGAGEPVLFLNGAGLTKLWFPFFDALSRETDVIVPEHPGFGDSPRPPWFRGLSDLIIHYHEMIRRLELQRVHLVGFSLGGWVAAELASFYPDMVASLTLMSPIGLRAKNPGPDIFQMGDELSQFLCKYPDRLPAAPALRSRQEIAAAYAESSAAALYMWTPRYNVQLARRLARFSAPALVLRGTEDRLVPEETALRYVEALPNVRDVVLPDSGHAVFLDQPHLAADAVLEHIRGI